MKKAKTKKFKAVTVTREDIMLLGINESDVDRITDEQMEYIATKIGDTLVGEMYWELLQNLSKDVIIKNT